MRMMLHAAACAAGRRCSVTLFALSACSLLSLHGWEWSRQDAHIDISGNNIKDLSVIYAIH